MSDRIRVWVTHFPDREALQLQWSDPVTRRKRTRTAGTSEETKAEQARQDLEYELNHGLHVEPNRVTWSSFREAFEAEYLPGCRKRTQGNYRLTFGHFERMCSPTTLAGVTARTLSSFVSAMRCLKEPSKGVTEYKPVTITLHLTLLRAALTWGIGQGLLSTLPAFPEIHVPRKRPQPVPAELFDRLEGRLKDNQLKAFAACGWYAGMRRNEAYYLEWEPTVEACWVDFAASRIHFPAEVVKAKEDQWVPISRELREALQRLPRRKGDPRVFAFRGDPHSVVAKLSRAAKAAGVRLTMRTLRRGFGCRMAAHVPAQVLQRLMRHSNISITMGYYANVDDAVMEAILGKGNTEGNTLPKKCKNAS